MSIFSDLTFYFHGEFPTPSKEELRTMVESNGGRVNVRITVKTSYIICSTVTKDIVERAQNHNTTILDENYILDCISSKKRLTPSNYLVQGVEKRRTRKDESKSDDPNVYNFVSTSPDNTDKENYVNKIRDKLKKISLKTKRDKDDTDDRDSSTQSSKKVKVVASNKCDNCNSREPPILPLKDLVFFIYGKFSISANVLKSIILENGGSVACAVDDKVTHFLFGGESVDVPEFLEAQKRKIHIVNEYFLRLLVKY